MTSTGTTGATLVRINRVEARIEDRPWPWAEEHADRIAAHWRQVLRDKPQTFNGTVTICRVREFDGPALRLVFVPTQYAASLYYRSLGYPPEAASHVYPLAALRAADGAYLLGRMAPHTTFGGSSYFPSGSVEPRDAVDGRLDLTTTLLRELQEETGLTPEDVTLAPHWYAWSRGALTGLLRPVSSPLPGPELLALVNERIGGQENPEHSGFYLVHGPDELDGSVLDSTRAYAEAGLG